MNVEQLLKRALRSRLDPLNPPAFGATLVGRTRGRRSLLLALASGGLVVAVLAGTLAVQTLSSDRGAVGPIANEPTPTPSPSVTTTVDPVACIVGPWATYCPEAQWARAVAEEAGYSVTGDTGSALEIDDGAHSFNFWAFEPEDDPSTREEALQAENYELFTEIDDTSVFFDGARLTWEVHGLYAWLTDQEQGDGPTEKGALERIVRASIDLPYGPNPRLAVSDETVRAGEVTDLHIEATENYMWGVATAFETFRDGGWVVLHYWSTGGDKSLISEPFSAEEEIVVPSLGFWGTASFRMRIPDVAPGDYRITKEFVTTGSEPVEERTTTATVEITVVP